MSTEAGEVQFNDFPFTPILQVAFGLEVFQRRFVSLVLDDDIDPQQSPGAVFVPARQYTNRIPGLQVRCASRVPLVNPQVAFGAVLHGNALGHSAQVGKVMAAKAANITRFGGEGAGHTG
jgi:hypothetical protein